MDEAWLEDLDVETCLMHLRANPVGRLAIVVDGFPIVLPVNYRLVETSGLTWVAIRTRPGNLCVSESVEVCEFDGTPLVLRQLAQGRTDLRYLVAPAVVNRRRIHHGVVVEIVDYRESLTRAEPVNGVVARDRHGPGERAADGFIKAARFVPDSQKDFLQDILRLPRIVEQANCESMEQFRVAIVKFGKSFAVALGDAAYQLPFHAR